MLFKSKEGITGGTNLTDDEKAEIAKAARGFEAMFVNMMFKQMKQSMLDEFKDEEKDDYFGADTLESVGDMAFAEDVAKKGSGIGIAKMLYFQLTGGEELHPLTTIDNSDSRIGKSVAAEQLNKLKNINNNNFSYSNSGSFQENQVSSNKGNFLGRAESRISAYNDIIDAASEKFGVPTSLIKSIITAESAGKADAKSNAGAKGLMQLMDGTAKSLGVSDSFNPYQNIMGGTKYIRKMLDRFGGSTSLALAAYNAGPGNVDKYDGIPPFKETLNYVKKVNEYMQRFEK